MVVVIHRTLSLRRGAILLRIWRTATAALERSRQRRALMALPDTLLRDIGLSRRDAIIEASKPFWRR